MKGSFGLMWLFVLATTTKTQLTNQSANFKLVLQSEDHTYDGQALGACHEGAAQESLCPSGAPNATLHSQSFYFNSTPYDIDYNETIGELGFLIWDMPYGDGQLAASAMFFEVSLASNVNVPLFFPGNGTGDGINRAYVAFDDQNYLNIQSYDSGTGTPIALYHWYICNTTLGETYDTLAWVAGAMLPDNPTCCYVRVQRKFI